MSSRAPRAVVGREEVAGTVSRPDDIEYLTAKLALFYADLAPGRLAALTEEALTAAAGNAASAFRV